MFSKSTVDEGREECDIYGERLDTTTRNLNVVTTPNPMKGKCLCLDDNGRFWKEMAVQFSRLANSGRRPRLLFSSVLGSLVRVSTGLSSVSSQVQVEVEVSLSTDALVSWRAEEYPYI